MGRLLALSLSLLFGSWFSAAQAHFSDGSQIRDIVLVEGAGETRIYVRTPLPLVFADDIARAIADGRPIAAPLLYIEQTGRGARYRLDTAAIAHAPDAFAARLLDSLRIIGPDVAPELGAFRISARRPASPFDSAETADAALDLSSTGLDPVFGEAVLEYVLRLPAGSEVLAVQAGFPPIALADGITIDTHLIRDTGVTQQRATHEGQMQDPVPFPVGPLQALGQTLWLGLVAVITGVDHALFLICLTLGLGWSGALRWALTALTLGLLTGPFLAARGSAPSLSGFGTGLDIVAMAVVLVAAWLAWCGGLRRRSPGLGISLAAVFGLIQGIGAAPDLTGILPADPSPLIGFAIGLTLGQLAIVLLTLGLMATFGPLTGRARTLLRV